MIIGGDISEKLASYRGKEKEENVSTLLLGDNSRDSLDDIRESFRHAHGLRRLAVWQLYLVSKRFKV